MYYSQYQFIGKNRHEVITHEVSFLGEKKEEKEMVQFKYYFSDGGLKNYSVWVLFQIQINLD